MPTPAERARFTAAELQQMDAEDQQYDTPGVDWEVIVAETEADRYAGRTMSSSDFVQQCLHDLEKLERMTPEELDHVIATDGEI
jgi:hypothetical protein